MPHGPRLALFVYCVFILYGSFFPFRFTADLAEVWDNLARAELSLYAGDGSRAFSLLDALSNVLVGGLFGVLLVGSALAGESLGSKVVRSAAASLAFASVVETGQIFLPERTASAIDVLAQGAGAALGAALSHALPRFLDTGTGRRLVAAARERPALPVAAVLAGVLAADALYPYAVTLDRSVVRDNLARAQLAPMASLGRAFWGDLLVEKVLVYAALGASACRAWPWPRGGREAILASAGCIAFAVLLEMGKLFIVRGVPAVDNILLATAGTLLGAASVGALEALGGPAPARAARIAWLAAALLVYEELTPFDFSLSVRAAVVKLANAEWLPFAAYYWADPRSALFDMGKKLLLSGFLGGSLAATGLGRPVLAVLALGATLEAAQVLQRSHLPSVTDVLVFGIGAVLGVAAWRRCAPPGGGAERASLRAAPRSRLPAS